MLRSLLACARCKQSARISGGLHIRGNYICGECETELVQMNAQDQQYQQILTVIKKMLF